MRIAGAEPKESFGWPQRLLNVGDEVSLRWVEGGKSDRPPNTKRWPKPAESIDHWLASVAKDCEWIAAAKGRRASALLADLHYILEKHQRGRKRVAV
jgi:hypothetical protein